MDSFKSKYPAVVALFVLVAAFAKDLAVAGESVLQKVEGELALAPQILQFYPQASQLGPELTLIKESPTDIEAGIEVLVTDLAFSSEKAQAIITQSFAVGEWIVAGVAPLEGLKAAISG